MPRPIRRVVAGHDANGKAAIVKDARTALCIAPRQSITTLYYKDK